MTGIYYAEMLDVLVAAACRVAENDITAGWRERARSSGGFPAPPLAVWWHHTASSTTPESDLHWMIRSSDDAPIGNLLLDRTGTFWPIAAGASNCAGKGGPANFSRGTVPANGGNSRGWQLEVANNGVGEPWPVEQIDAYIAGSNALNAHVGNEPIDVITHHEWAPTRKIDPSTADAVQGPWRPGPATSSGTWNLDDIKAECARRAGSVPAPIPPGDDMAITIFQCTDADAAFVGASANGVGVHVSWADAAMAARYRAIGSVVQQDVNVGQLQSMILLGRLPEGDSRHHWDGAEFAGVVT